jgi:hypothetical protein
LSVFDLPQSPGEELVRNDGALRDLGVLLAEALQWQSLAMMAGVGGDELGDEAVRCFDTRDPAPQLFDEAILEGEVGSFDTAF